MGWPIVIICVLIAAMFYMRMKARADKDPARAGCRYCYP